MGAFLTLRVLLLAAAATAHISGLHPGTIVVAVASSGTLHACLEEAVGGRGGSDEDGPKPFKRKAVSDLSVAVGVVGKAQWATTAPRGLGGLAARRKYLSCASLTLICRGIVELTTFNFALSDARCTQ